MHERIKINTGDRKCWLSCLLLLLLVPLASLPIYGDAGTDRHYQQALKELSLGKTGRAERLLNRVVYFEPRHLQARLRLIDIYIGQRRYREALKLSEDGLTLRPDEAELWIKKGLVLRESGSRSEAQIAYDKAVSLAPQDAGVLRRASGYYRLIGNTAKARALNLRRKQLQDPGDPAAPASQLSEGNPG